MDQFTKRMVPIQPREGEPGWVDPREDGLMDFEKIEAAADYAQAREVRELDSVSDAAQSLLDRMNEHGGRAFSADRERLQGALDRERSRAMAAAVTATAAKTAGFSNFYWVFFWQG